VLVTRAAHGQEGDGGRGGMRVFTQLLYLCQSCFRRCAHSSDEAGCVVDPEYPSKRQSFKAKSVVLLVGDVGRLVTLSNGR
jgi:hypothetical protein